MGAPILRDFLESFRDRRPALQGVQPGGIMLILLDNRIQLAELCKQAFPNHGPGDKRQICICALVAYEPASPIAHQAFIQHTYDALGLVHVSVCGRRNTLWMKAGEPCGLADVWTLSCVKLLDRSRAQTEG